MSTKDEVERRIITAAGQFISLMKEASSIAAAIGVIARDEIEEQQVGLVVMGRVVAIDEKVLSAAQAMLGLMKLYAPRSTGGSVQ